MKFLLGLVATAALAATAHAQPPGDTPPMDDLAPAPVAPVDPIDPFDDDDRRGFDAARGGGQRDFYRDHRAGDDRQMGRRGKDRRKMQMMKRLARRFDQDRDGSLSPPERQALKRFIRLRKFDRVIQRLDRNRDGKLGPGEVPQQMMHKLRRLDRNGDGWVTRDEVAMPQQRRQGRRGPR